MILIKYESLHGVYVYNGDVSVIFFEKSYWKLRNLLRNKSRDEVFFTHPYSTRARLFLKYHKI